MMKGYLKCPNSEIFYEVTGSGPAIVFAHGLGGNYLSWWQQIPYFSQLYTCITFSHRGFWPNGATTVVQDMSIFADDLAALIDHLQLDTVFLVAQSFGGWTCLEYTRQHQSRVRALIMASTTGTLNYTIIAHPEIDKIKDWKDRVDKEKINLLSRSIIPGAGSRMAEEQSSLYYLFRQINELTPSKYKESLRAAIHNARTLTPEKFSQVTAPVLFVTGEEDLLFPPAAATAASSLLVEAWCKSIPKSGHSTYFERPQIFNQMVDEFLTSKCIKEQQNVLV